MTTSGIAKGRTLLTGNASPLTGFEPETARQRRGNTDQLISITDIRALFKLGRTAAYELTHRAEFPAPVQVSRRCLRWWASEVDAYADALLDAGRTEQAREWFARAAAADPDELTDAAERFDDLDEVVIDDLADEDGDGDDDDGHSGCLSIEYCPIGGHAEVELARRETFYDLRPEERRVLDCVGEVLILSGHLQRKLQEILLIADPQHRSRRHRRTG